MVRFRKNWWPVGFFTPSLFDENYPMGILRLLLALSVVLDHAAPHAGMGLVGGPLAVEGFFIISGFYMALILNEKYVGANNSYKLFITNRLLRLYPVYWAVLIPWTAYCVFAYATTHQYNFIGHFVRHYGQMDLSSFAFLVFTNLTMFFQDVVLFLGLDVESGNLFFTKNVYETQPRLYEFLAVGQAWSIGIELAFYLIAPFLMRRTWKVILPLVAASFLFDYVMAVHGLDHDPWTYRFFPFELGYFLLGKIAYDLYKAVGRYGVKRAWCLCALCAVMAYLFAYPLLPPFRGKDHFFISSLFLSIPLVFQLTKKWKRDAWVGELSYPIYIVHMAVIEAVSRNQLVVVSLSLLAAVLLNEFVAKPVEAFRQGRLHKSKERISKRRRPVLRLLAKRFWPNQAAKN